VKIKGKCRNCGREVFVQQIRASHGHCPWCGKPFQSEYTAVLIEALEQAEAAGNTLENALEKVAGMRPALVLDEDSVLTGIERYLEELKKSEPPRYP
jgi:DNA repair exonuclease SbcCD ATPase subunit